MFWNVLGCSMFQVLSTTFSITGEPLCFANLQRNWLPAVRMAATCRQSRLNELPGGSRFVNEKKIFQVICSWPIAKLFVGLVYLNKNNNQIVLKDKEIHKSFFGFDWLCACQNNRQYILMQAKGYTEFTIQHTHFIFFLLINVYV